MKTMHYGYFLNGHYEPRRMPLALHVHVKLQTYVKHCIKLLHIGLKDIITPT